jgi:photosystem II stability/assembly factor-like uncharacterized protein
MVAIDPAFGLRTVFTSNDGGQKWAKRFGSSHEQIEIIVGDENRANTIYAGGFTGKLFKSTNFGKDWVAVHDFSANIRNIAVDKSDSNRIYVFAQQEDSGVYISENGGRTWNFVSFGITAENPWMIAWAVAQNDDYLFVAGETRATVEEKHQPDYRPPVLRSNDGGLTWENIFPTNRWHIYSIEIDEAGDAIYFHRETNILYKSIDNGDTMEEFGNHFGMFMVSNENNPEEVFFGEGVFSTCAEGCFDSNGEIWKTSDGGETFDLLLSNHYNVVDMDFDSDFSTLFISTHGNGVQKRNISELPVLFSINHADLPRYGYGTFIPPE